jgi:hypothetical protein
MIERIETVDGYSIIRGFDECPIDPEETRAAVEAQIRQHPELANKSMMELFNTYTVYSEPGPGRKRITDAEYAARKAQFDALGEHQLLTETLEIIPDFTGVEYWQEAGGRWGKHKIEAIGVTVPADGVPPEALTGPQGAEIAAQEQGDRIAALSPADREAEKQARIKAVIHEAAIKKQEAEIEAEIDGTASTFDHIAWVQERKSEIEALYA